ncbi:MAG: hypothetical protein HN742_03915 [Lentisphaerae bacterium]|nr:hypothetical protein [Lentisphaerota bacterium]MBT4819365.1 hypothetical protein [Lentisphaerota bacterium]MBT5607291.1 hypothetical protein [Lentisphaerota bacterium]MBT7055391.1 hypothetical protein [Lentisphaerota bacterium]MBT7840989.1 hypothetical protein [Lentisphaerota bacterium]
MFLRPFHLGVAALALSYSSSAALPQAQPVEGGTHPEIPAAAVADCGAFAIRGYHQHIFPDRQPMSTFHRRLEQLAERDYNLVVFGLGHPGAATITLQTDGTVLPNGCSTEEMRRLVAHAVELGLEPVFEMKFIGKQLPLIAPLLEEHPGLVIDPKNRATVLNAAYKMPDGREAYPATALRLVGYLLDLYPDQHPPKFFHFGIDEFDADDMATLAAAMDMTPPQAFAYCLNLGTDFVLARNVTPMIWGDVLLSATLGTPEHGITLPGFVPDPRHKETPGGAYHANYKSGAISLHTMVNHLRDREKIIVADWHYSASSIGEFPSVDYFLGLGFKDVWGCPWFNATNLRQFSRYAASRNCGGMLATAWHMAYLPTKRLLFRHIVWNSAVYFHAPSIQPPETLPATYTITGMNGQSMATEKRTGLIMHGDLEVTFRAPVPEAITPASGVLFLVASKRGAQALEVPLSFAPETRELLAEFVLPREIAPEQHFQLAYGYADSATGYFFQKECAQGLMLTGIPPALPATRPGEFLKGEFESLPDATLKQTVWLGGECATPIGSALPRKRAATPRPGGLDTAWFDRLWAYPSDYLNQTLTNGMRIEIEAKMTDTFDGNDFCALLTKGSFATGFRILVRKDGKLLFQFAKLNEGNPLWVYSESPLPRNEWVRIALTYRPPTADGPGEAAIQFGEALEGRAPIEVAMPASTSVIGIGCEFTDPRGGPTGKRRPNFPGLIRSFTIGALE